MCVLLRMCGTQATKFKRLCRRAKTSRNKALQELKAELQEYLPAIEGADDAS